MAFIIEKREEQLVDALSSPEEWAKRNPAMAGLFESNRELQNGHQERGTRLLTPEWKHVASFPSTLLDAVGFIREGNMILDKKGFYAWLKRNRQWAAYDIRFGAGPSMGGS